MEEFVKMENVFVPKNTQANIVNSKVSASFLTFFLDMAILHTLWYILLFIVIIIIIAVLFFMTWKIMRDLRNNQRELVEPIAGPEGFGGSH